MSKTIGLIASILIHLLIVLLFIWPKLKEPPKPPPPGKPFEETVVRLIPITEPAIEKPKRDGDTPELRAIKEQICAGKDTTYTGIGLIWQPGTGFVIEAPPGFPAYDAGIRRADVLQNPYFQPDSRGWVVVRVERFDKQLTFRVKQQKICFERPEPAEITD